MSVKLGEKRIKTIDISDLEMIEMEKGFNPRLDLGDIKELASQIEAAGEVRTPLRVQRSPEGGLIVRSGHRRLAALRMLKKKGTDIAKIPLILEDPQRSKVDLYIDLIMDNEGRPLAPIEEAEVYRRLREEGFTYQEIAAKVGKNHVTVYNRLQLLDATPELQDAVREKKIPVSTGERIMQETKDDPKRQKQLVKEASKGKEERKEVLQDLDEERKGRNTNTPRKSSTRESKPQIKLVPTSTARRNLEGFFNEFCEAAGEFGYPSFTEIMETLDDNSVFLGYCIGRLDASVEFLDTDQGTEGVIKELFGGYKKGKGRIKV